MGDIMRPIQFGKMVDWILNEYKNQNTIFGIRNEKFYKNKTNKKVIIFGDELSSPIGPAAGPNSQLAQNIIASYLAGARFIELKTVQIMDGERLRKCVAKPCINAEDEGFNVEWSTELTVEEAFDEYIKAWFLIQIIAKELNISSKKDFSYNMSVGYDLEGIKSSKIDFFIEGLKDSSNTKIFKECKKYLINNKNKFKNIEENYIKNISPNICKSITLSTLHGCPPEEIEKIARYLLEEKKVHTFVKCNPTLLGYDFVRDILSKMGYENLEFGIHHFNNDLQYKDGIKMIHRLLNFAKNLNKQFGVKLTNTFAMPIKNKELPGEEMYMSGRSLFPLTISLANKLSKEFKGCLPISFSGGADHFNIKEIFKTGIKPITFATTILKPGGYERIKQLAEDVEDFLDINKEKINLLDLDKISNNVIYNKYHIKSHRPVKSRKTSSKLNLFDCAKAPCKNGGCPINQKIPEYLYLVNNYKYDEAFDVIFNDNSCPAITSKICDHQCQSKCTRLDYESSLKIREMKNIAVINSQDNYINKIKTSKILSEKKVAVIGAGPAGIATALFLRRNGVETTIFEKKEESYGIVKYVIPEFRISNEMIKKDFDLAKKIGVIFKFGVEIKSIDFLKKDFDYIVIAIGSWGKCISPFENGKEKTKDALEFLENFKTNNGNISLGKNVAVIGGGDVAMDCARAAKRVKGVENVYIVYRRTKNFMPSQPEEKEDALKDGIIFKELISPISYNNNILNCNVMKLGDKDFSGRKSVKPTEEKIKILADTVILSTGATLNKKFFIQNNINLNDIGLVKIDENNETKISNVYIAGDCKKGPSTIVKAIADAKIIAKNILFKNKLNSDFSNYSLIQNKENIYSKKGVLIEELKNEKEGNRCLVCDQICEICCDVCPNRANILIKTRFDDFVQNHQILHVDYMCNECGNCGIFCPHEGNPYKDKISLFSNKEDFLNSKNKGFLPIDNDSFKIRKEDGSIVIYKLGEKGKISKNMENILKIILNNYNYLIL